MKIVPFFLLLHFLPQAINVEFSGGQNRMNPRGHSVFRSLRFEIAGRSEALPRWLRREEVGAALTYSAVRQARSWFGYKFGEPDDEVRAESLCVFIRHSSTAHPLGLRPFADLGTGPMWSNRRVPAATSRFNLNSQVSLGVVAFSGSIAPVRLGYRFQHISNGGITSRNPGLNVNSFFIGVQVKKLGN